MSRHHNYRPQQDRSSYTRNEHSYQQDLSDAETSEGEHYQKRRNSDARNQTRPHGRPSQRQAQVHYNHQRPHFVTQKNKQNKFKPNHQLLEDSSYSSDCKSKNHKQNEAIQVESKFVNQNVEEQARDIILQIQSLNYEKPSFQEIHKKFTELCKDHLSFREFYPQSQDVIGQQLVKNGFFHQIWSKVVLKNPIIQKQTFLQSYFSLFRARIQKGLTSFENTFNAIPDSDEETNPESEFKRYRQKYESNTTSTTKMDCMIVYQQVKAEMKTQELEQNFGKKIIRNVEQWKLQTAQDQLLIRMSYKEIQDTLSSDQKDDYSRWEDQDQKSTREEAINKLKRLQMREKSPLSNRFRIVQECQTTQRRMTVQSACVFFAVDQYFHLNDLQIVKIEESIFSDKQQILVVKAYTVDFSPEMGKMKIQPKVKNLISVYKFSGFEELIRLERTHGKFDGIIIYPESFNIKKYMQNNMQQLSLLKDDYLKDVKQQLPVPLVASIAPVVPYSEKYEVEY